MQAVVGKAVLVAGRELADLGDYVRTWRFWRALIATALGSLLFGAVINGLLIPHGFMSGGLSGVALLLFYLFGKPSVGVSLWLFNIPIFFLALRAMSLRYVLIAGLGAFLSGVGVEAASAVVIPVHDPMLAAILAGILSGIGLGGYLRYGGSTGGLDIIATVVKKRFAIPLGTTFLVVNAGVIVAGALLHGVETALYSAIYLFVLSAVMEKTQTGLTSTKSVFIISSKPDLVARDVLQLLDRDMTYFEATGARSDKQRRVLYTVINMVELGRLKNILHQVDPDAFVVVNDTTEVIGNRFLNWADQGYE